MFPKLLTPVAVTVPRGTTAPKKSVGRKRTSNSVPIGRLPVVVVVTSIVPPLQATLNHTLVSTEAGAETVTGLGAGISQYPGPPRSSTVWVPGGTSVL